MRKTVPFIAAAVLLLSLVAAAPAAAQDAVVVIKPCALTYATPIAANTPIGLHARGYCGIPSNATGLFLHVKVGDEVLPGKLWFWTNSDMPNGDTLIHNSQCNYQDAVAPNPVSCHVLTRIDDGYYNLWVESSAAVNLSVVVEGYTVPIAGLVGKAAESP